MLFQHPIALIAPETACDATLKVSSVYMRGAYLLIPKQYRSAYLR